MDKHEYRDHAYRATKHAAALLEQAQQLLSEASVWWARGESPMASATVYEELQTIGGCSNWLNRQLESDSGLAWEKRGD